MYQKNKLLFYHCIIILQMIMLAPMFSSAQYYNTFPKYLNANKNIGVYGGAYSFKVNEGLDLDFKVNPNGYMNLVPQTNFIVSDPQNGNILFTTEQRKITEYESTTLILNKDNQVVEGGDFEFYNEILEMMHFTTVVPTVDDDYTFYIFYYKNSDSRGVLFDLMYAVLDMNANNGAGKVIEKDIVLRKGLVKQFQRGVIPGNSCNLWVLFFDDYEDQLYTYELKNKTLDTLPILTKMNLNVGLEQANNPVFKISPDRQTLFMSTTITDRNSPEAFNGVYVQDLFFWKFDLETGKAYNGMRVRSDIRQSLTPFANYEFIDHTKIVIAFNATYGRSLGEEYIIDISQYDENYIRDNLRRLKNLSSDAGEFIEYKKYNNYLYRLKPGGSEFNPGDMTWNYSSGKLEGILMTDLLDDKEPTPLNFNEATMLRGFNFEGSSSINNMFSYEIVYPLPEGLGFTNGVHAIDHCFEQSTNVALSVPRESEYYVWDDGSTSRDRIVTKPGKYWVEYPFKCVTLIDSFYVYDIYENTPIYNIDTIGCTQHFPIKVNLNTQVDSILINNNFYSQYIPVEAPMNATMEHYKMGCVKASQLIVNENICPCDIFKPNAFTPNGDGNNDYFKPIILGGCVPSNYLLKIYDRWGKMVYASYNSTDLGWDGSLDGKPAPSGVYLYTFEVKDQFTGASFFYKGDVTLIR
jgi:gliding motility-associated-like protein